MAREVKNTVHRKHVSVGTNIWKTASACHVASGDTQDEEQRMLKAYVIGPYTAPTSYEVDQNIQRAKVVAAKLWKLGYAVFCPHTNAAHFEGAAPNENFLKGDLEWLAHTDIAVVLEDFEKSKGSLDEIEFCLTHNIKIFYNQYDCIWEYLADYVEDRDCWNLETP